MFLRNIRKYNWEQMVAMSAQFRQLSNSRKYTYYTTRERKTLAKGYQLVNLGERHTGVHLTTHESFLNI